MKKKLEIATSLSHHPRLLILDEPTSGLDPIVRGEVLDLFREFMESDDHSILISSHITSDLEKVSDYIVFIDKGKVIFFESKDKILYEYGILKCTEDELDKVDKRYILKQIKTNYGYNVIITNKEEIKKQYSNLVVDNCTIDELMVIYTKGV